MPISGITSAWLLYEMAMATKTPAGHWGSHTTAFAPVRWLASRLAGDARFGKV